MRQVLLVILATVFLVLGPVARAQTWTQAPAIEAVDAPAPPPPAGWLTERGPFLRVHGPPDYYTTVLRVARHASAVLPELADQLGVPIGETIHLYVASSTREFRDIQPGRAPTWADATAYPGNGTIYLRAPPARGGMARPIEQVVDHELVHVLLGRVFAPRQPPSWLQEGVAQVWAGEHGPDHATKLLVASAQGALVSLEDLSRGFPGDPRRAELAYVQSADFVSWLRSEHGDAAVRDLVRAMAAGKTVEAAMYGATGVFLDDLDRGWRRQFEQGPIQVTTLLNENVLFGFAGIALVVGGMARRRAFHRRLREMEEEERLLDDLVAQTRPNVGWAPTGPGLGTSPAGPS